MEFETPASFVELFVRDDGPGVNSVTRVFDVNDVEILTVSGNDTGFTEVTITRGPGETLIDRVTLENGGAGSSVWDDVTFTANNQPDADAGSNENVIVGDLVQLDGSGSDDPDGDTLSFSWTLTTPAGSGATLSNPNIVNPTFTADVEGTYTAELIVNDGTVDSDPDSVTITATAPANTPPVADAGPDQSVDTGDLVQLDGSGSSDADGDTLTFSWTLTTPGGSGATLSDPNIVNPTFTPDLEGTYTAELTVDDGTDSDSDTVSITATDVPPPNTPPVADAGPDQSVDTGDLVQLDGTGSSDADGDTLTFSWTLTTPAGSGATLSSPTSATPTFTADVDGAYTAQLVVNDGTEDSAPDTATITATTANTAPVADAGPDQSVDTGDLVQLDGTGSSDADGDALTFSWTLTTPPGSGATLSSPTSATPTFTADVDGAYTAQLVVNDGTEDSAPDTATITATTANTAPVADAGPDQSVNTGDLVQLDGTGSSDADGDALTFSWTLTTPAGSGATLSSPTSATPTFTADVDGTYTAQLVVNDGTEDSAPDTATITATTGNTAPLADAGPDQSVNTGDLVQLDGTGSSDADGDTLTFSWSLTAPAGSGATLSDTTSATPTFTADVEGTYTATLVVNDGTDDSAPDTVTITATTANTAPIADAGPDQSVATGDTVQLDGTGSSDADGDPLTFSWTLTSPAGSGASLSDATSATPTFTTDVEGTYTAQLVVNDGTEDSAPDTATITATTGNAAPIADAGPDQSVATGDTVQLDGTGSNDADGDALTFSWTLTSPAGSGASLSDATSATPTFTADVEGTYTAQLVVNDGTEDSAPDTATITATTGNAAPIADAGPDQSVATGDTVQLDGTGSSDADGDALTFSWTLTSPAGSGASLSDATSATPTFTADVEGTYTAQLVVNDGTEDSAPDTATITATTGNAAPIADAGPDQSVATGDLVQLDGTGSSDADGDTLTFSWTLTTPAGSGASLSDATSATPTFTADVEGTYTAQLVVNDGTEDSAPDTATITATTGNAAPIADAGPDQSVATGDTVQLDGTGSSDADGDALTFSWTLTSPAGSGASLSDATSATPTFTADVEGTYTAQLVVNDGTEDSAPDSVTITASTDNTAPTADAGPDQSVTTGDVVQLDGSASSDDDGDALTFSWTLTSPAGSGAVLSDATSETPTFAADVDGTYTAELVVNDGTEDSAPDTATITAASVEPASGAVIVGNDEWTLRDDGFSNAPDAGTYVENLARFFAGSEPGTFHGFSTQPALTGDSLAAAFDDAGHTWTTGVDIPFDVDTLLGFDAIFLAGDAVDNDVLIDYVSAGGNVYLIAGTGDDAEAEAAQWNTFLANSGLELTFPYNGIEGNIAIDSPHPIFDGVAELFQISGNSIVDLRPDDPLTEILVSLDGEGLYAISESAGLEVVIDIRPGVDVNKVIPGSTQRIPVAILTTSKAAGEAVDFDATQVDPYSVRFGPNETGIRQNQHQIKDVDGDGDQDLLLRFRALETGIQCGDSQADLSGETFAGQRIRGSDSVKTVCK